MRTLRPTHAVTCHRQATLNGRRIRQVLNQMSVGTRGLPCNPDDCYALHLFRGS